MLLCQLPLRSLHLIVFDDLFVGYWITAVLIYHLILNLRKGVI